MELNSDLRNSWYPISFSKDLKPGEVVSLHILGDPICLYRTFEGEAVVFADRCAHRSAPLSIGNLREGKLECKYHGWQYDTNGEVSKIPALLEDHKIPANAKVYAYPVQETQGYVWVWPGNKSLAKPNTIPFLQPPFGSPMEVAVDLDIEFSLMVENLLDPAHLPFTHEGTLAKRSDAKPIKMANVRVEECKELEIESPIVVLKADLQRAGGDLRVSSFTFVPPCTVLLFSSR
jgi:phenylpropionate dioxygenase-like ring-hydroxylating dioxygenase large terminal subunit